VLIVCGRAGGELYWRSIQEWVRDPVARAKGYVRFEKERDRFDAQATAQLFDLKAASTDRIEPPGPLPQPETLLTNLMPIRWKTDRLLSIGVPPFQNPSELFAPAWERDLRHPAGVLKAGRYWSLEPFDPAFVEAIGGAGLSTQPLAPVLVGEDPDATNILKELVVRAIAARAPELRWHAFKRVAYFSRHGEQEDVQHSWSKGLPKTVVFANFSKDEDKHFTGYRHDAADLRVRDLGEQWAVQIAPTYLFTWDGKQISGHHHQALAGIKRFDKHRAVSASLRMWERLLVDDQTLTHQGGHHGFGLDWLLTVPVPLSIDENAWKKLSDSEAIEAQGTIFDELDAAA